jgi:hypothetical protein
LCEPCGSTATPFRPPLDPKATVASWPLVLLCTNSAALRVKALLYVGAPVGGRISTSTLGKPRYGIDGDAVRCVECKNQNKSIHLFNPLELPVCETSTPTREMLRSDGMRFLDAPRYLFQQRMSVRQLVRIPGREPMSNRLLSDLVFGHRRNDLVVHE